MTWGSTCILSLRILARHGSPSRWSHAMRFTAVALSVADRSTDRHGQRGSRRHRRARSRPLLELLETRALLAAITEFPAPTPNALPSGVASGIVAVPGGDVWFTEPGANKIGMINTATGSATDYAIPTPASSPQGITFGPDGNLWFTEAAANKIGVINTSGTVIAQYAVPTAASDPEGITVGPDGNVWFTEPGAGKIGRIIPSTGQVSDFPIPTAGGQPTGITAGPDGNLWFTEPGATKVGMITTAGVVTQYAVPTPGGVTEGISSGSDGNIWFTEPGAAQVGRITPTGVVTEFATPTSSSQPWGITNGPDGNPWFTEAGANKVGQVALAQLLKVTGSAVATHAGTSYSLTVGTFLDANPNATVNNFQATINWGDGHITTGTISTPNPQPTRFYTVTGTNTYATAGTYSLEVTITDLGGSSVTTAPSTVIVGNVPVLLSGHIDPASISGPDKNLNITNVNRPTFEGLAAPYAIVQLFAQQANTYPTTYMSLGQTMSGPDGAWSLTSPRLPDGVYTVTASMTSQAGFPTAPVLIVTPDNPLYIDTVGPRVTGMVFDPTTGIITVVISDAWSGLDQTSLLDPSNYTIMPRRSLIGSNSKTPSLAPAISGFYTNAQSATLQFVAPIAPGSYLFEVKSGGVIDRAGNPLDGEFSGSLPSGNGVPGGNFIARITVPRHHPLRRRR